LGCISEFNTTLIVKFKTLLLGQISKDKKMTNKKSINLNTELPKKLRAKRIAKEFGVGLSTVWLYAKQGKLTPIQVTERVTVFDTQEVLALFDGAQL